MYGEKLKKLRNQYGLTQDSMAKFLGVSPRTYVAYERDENNPPYSMLVSLCSTHNVNLNWFIADIGNMFNPPKYEDVKDDILAEVERMLKNRGL